jgi:hypothetical protein
MVTVSYSMGWPMGTNRKNNVTSPYSLFKEDRLTILQRKDMDKLQLDFNKISAKNVRYALFQSS